MQQEPPKAAAGPAGPDRLTELKDRVDGLSRLLDRLDEARTIARRTRIGIVIVTILLLTIYIWNIFSGLRSFYLNKAPTFVAELQSQSMKTAIDKAPDLWDRAQSLLVIYREELRKQLRPRGPEIEEKFLAEVKTLTDNLADACHAKIQTRLDTMAERQEERVIAAFPRAADDATREIVMVNLEAAFQEATLNVLKDRVAQGKERLGYTYDRILRFLPESGREECAARLRQALEEFLLLTPPGMIGE